MSTRTIETILESQRRRQEYLQAHEDADLSPADAALYSAIDLAHSEVRWLLQDNEWKSVELRLTQVVRPNAIDRTIELVEYAPHEGLEVAINGKGFYTSEDGIFVFDDATDTDMPLWEWLRGLFSRG